MRQTSRVSPAGIWGTLNEGAAEQGFESVQAIEVVAGVAGGDEGEAVLG